MPKSASDAKQTAARLDTWRGFATKYGADSRHLLFSELATRDTRACLNNIHVCDGSMWDAVLGAESAAISRILQGLATTKCAQIVPSLRVVAKTGVCVVPSLANIRDIGYAPLLAAIPFWPQRIARILLRQALVLTRFSSGKERLLPNDSADSSTPPACKKLKIIYSHRGFFSIPSLQYPLDGCA